MENIGDKIKKLRRERHVSQEALAYGVGVTANTVSRWEKNAISPTATNLEALIKFFGVSADYFIGDDKGDSEAENHAEEGETEAVKTEETEGKISSENADKKNIELKIPLYLKITLIAACALFFGGGAALMFCIFGYNILPEALRGSSLTFVDNIITVSMPLPTLIILLFLLVFIFTGLGLGIYSLITIHKFKK